MHCQRCGQLHAGDAALFPRAECDGSHARGRVRAHAHRSRLPAVDSGTLAGRLDMSRLTMDGASQYRVPLESM